MTDLERAAAECLRDALEQYMSTPCPNSAPCFFCKLQNTCHRVTALYHDIKVKLGEEV